MRVYQAGRSAHELIEWRKIFEEEVLFEVGFEG